MSGKKSPRVSVGVHAPLAAQLRTSEASFDATRDLLIGYASARVADLQSDGGVEWKDLGSGDRILFILHQLSLEVKDGGEDAGAEIEGLKKGNEQLREHNSNLEKALGKQRIMAQNFFECLILAGGGEPPPR